MNKEWQLVNFCEFDKYATKSYCAVHNVDESLNLGDITKVDETQLDDFTMMCGGSPCQDFSVAGKQAGAEWTCADCGHKYNPLEAHWSTRDKCPICGSQNIEKTRSSLLVEYLRILRAKHPKFAMYENVKNIVGKQFKKTFDMFIAELNEYGYNTYWKVLNAKDYGVPQNRERVYIFIVDKTLDNGKFEFPDGFDNGIRLKDVLETEVDDKYYLSEETTARFIVSETSLSSNLGDNNTGIDKSVNKTSKIEYANCITAREDRGVSNRKSEGTAVIVQNPHGFNKGGDFEDCTTITSHSWECNNFLKSNFHIRKLTPKECWRLMGFSDKCFEVAKYYSKEESEELLSKYPNHKGKRQFTEEQRIERMSDSQLYKQAGNSIVTDVLYYIYLEIYKAMPYLFDNLKLTSLFSGIGAFEIALNRLYDTINSENFTQPQQK